MSPRKPKLPHLRPVKLKDGTVALDESYSKACAENYEDYTARIASQMPPLFEENLHLIRLELTNTQRLRRDDTCWTNAVIFASSAVRG